MFTQGFKAMCICSLFKKSIFLNLSIFKWNLLEKKKVKNKVFNFRGTSIIMPGSACTLFLGLMTTIKGKHERREVTIEHKVTQNL